MVVWLIGCKNEHKSIKLAKYDKTRERTNIRQNYLLFRAVRVSLLCETRGNFSGTDGPTDRNKKSL